MKMLFLTVMIFSTASNAFAIGANALADMCRRDLSDAGTYIMGFMEKYNDDKLVVDALGLPSIKREKGG